MHLPGLQISSRLIGLAAAVFALTFAVATYALAPDAPGRETVTAYVASRTTDQHFAGCDQARAAGREDIPRSDPSYRAWMDGDGDGLACEPPRGRRGGWRGPALHFGRQVR